VETKVKLTVQGLTNSHVESGAYVLVLSEDGPHCIPVIVGVAEAQAIAVALENLQPARPLTHDLFVSFAREYGSQLQEVFICKVIDGVFFAEMLFSDGAHELRIDSRTSDAVAIALRMKCDIYTTESILQEYGIVIEENEDDENDNASAEAVSDDAESQWSKSSAEWMQIMQTSEIEERMQRAISEENYEFAKLCKEELQRREEDGDEQE
jgi:bifunctional DNase/RNase